MTDKKPTYQDRLRSMLHPEGTDAPPSKHEVEGEELVGSCGAFGYLRGNRLSLLSEITSVVTRLYPCSILKLEMPCDLEHDGVSQAEFDRWADDGGPARDKD